jgi:acetyl esterase/lipase
MSKKPAVLVLPGGAYLFTSDREAEPIALAYAAKGFQAFVLRYSTHERATGKKPLAEASKAIGLIRKNAEKWHVMEDKIVTCGFSAGGHLSAWVGLCGENKPNAMILCYPAVELFSPERERELEAEGKPNLLINALLGNGYTDEEADSLNLIKYVGADSIPMFCWSTTEDVLTKASPILAFSKAYADAERPFELHMYQYGEHGMSLANFLTANGRKAMTDPQAETWMDMSVKWLYRNFGEPVIEDKPFEMIPGLVPGM